MHDLKVTPYRLLTSCKGEKKTSNYTREKSGNTLLNSMSKGQRKAVEPFQIKEA